ncbi:hypothetical protein RO3G_06902 [Rhizopus delemar RA 99-880]|uniref:Uncharacterized protein n=1 Tax=Rhizopus delemar (strain RA 99-880 / ATCC MYA-4621 / FGSC 9543 / NRRL 43880) TaxID=246409 RepID=I1C167_RHIO9|nr:hypothetical protein RO3G_06902 [Rhizopus delemar RA 99-880]|eukprot:EIE82197.1 hypothetical protein RO3G_06902 [Rhizopus delemar RA 99-880]
MSTLLFSENKDPDILLVNNKKKNKIENELEEIYKEATPDLPLSKSLYLLVNVHGKVFDKAVQTIRQSNKLELSLKLSESPTIKALLSIEKYFETNPTHFNHVYEPLKEKILKVNHPQHEASMRILGYFLLYSNTFQAMARDFIYQQIASDNKRDQLSSIVLLRFLYTHYIKSSSEEHLDFISHFMPIIVQVTEKYSESATLLSCSACELSLIYCWYLYNQFSQEGFRNDKKAIIMEIEEETKEKGTMENVIKQTNKLINIIRKWHKTKDELSEVAYDELSQLISSISNEPDATHAFQLITTYLTPKSVLSEKPLTMKKLKSIVSFKCKW